MFLIAFASVTASALLTLIGVAFLIDSDMDLAPLYGTVCLVCGGAGLAAMTARVERALRASGALDLVVGAVWLVGFAAFPGTIYPDLVGLLPPGALLAFAMFLAGPAFFAGICCFVLAMKLRAVRDGPCDGM